MKKILLLAAAAIMAAGAMQAKTADEVRVYLNPGHGSWGPNDRPMATIPYPALPETGRPDTCGFYESNTNLWKILKMGETLEKMGVKKENIMYSRVKNGPFPYVKGAADEELYNRNLTEISREVDANNMDIFVSIHSNAATDGSTANYPLYLYRGQDKPASGDYNHNEGSYEMCDAGWDARYMTEIDPNSYYSRTQKNIRGDWNFYGSTYETTTAKGTFTGYLGVLRHGTPGYLV
ncbi:MAG: N-acetylmuramoyl-L-alanine amidase, partial [Bacteroidales bacterium]|nr:N-acetylmuramoyl-L-alanine amidase [Candidatus Sodaliphilus limicaballi]